MSATDHSRAAGVLLLCRAEPDRVRPSAQLLREPLLLAPAGEDWSVLVPAEEAWRQEGSHLAAVTAEWAHALTVAESWPAVGLWWDEEGAGFVVAAGFRRTVGYTWLADGAPVGEEGAMTALRARLGLDPVLDAEAFDRLTRPDSDADAAARVLGVIAVLARSGLHLPPGLAPGAGAEALRTAAETAPEAEAVEWPGWREAVRGGLDASEQGFMGEWIRGPKARALGAAEIAAGVSLLVLARRGARSRRRWSAAGALLVADGALTIAYDAWRSRGTRGSGV
ncbi:hypothetical protein [Streptomyces griseocarneus]|uniref:hypothetical protein n=1 Tax=Streptomyces griseocarneus TaxID=51201 RepID=UPI00167D0B7F|nr:hypothetical protein [Streptomyces griseocarneus]MBZ6473437.1 hypothetical protein [Streptomyces griseocarneus]GHG56880.1 hypothetical protein GCM10018779_21540 [Streptomyces griseocarneus]